VTIVARAPGKVVAFGEYAVLEGAPAIVLAVDRYAEARLTESDDGRCHLETLGPDASARTFALGTPSGVTLVDLVVGDAASNRAWRGRLDSRAFYAGGAKLGLGSSAAAICAWAGAWRAFGGERTADAGPALDYLIALHRRFQSGTGSGLDVAASVCGGATIFRLEAAKAHVGSVRLPNSVGFAGIFAGRSASTPALLARYRAFCADQPRRAAELVSRLRSIAETGCSAARGDDADAFIAAITDYGRGLEDLGLAIGTEIVTAEHRQVREQASRYGVAYKVSGAGGGDLGIACAADREALDAFKKTMKNSRFGVVDLDLAERGLVVEELAA
jgi:phosphomevalonate kinase